MDICVICGPWWPVPPIRGGAVELITFELSKEFARRGHRVTTFSVKDPLLPNYEECNGIRYFRFRALPVPSLPWAFRRRGFWMPKMLFYCSSTLKKTIEIQHEVSVIHCFEPLVLLSQTVSKVLLRKPVVISVHATTPRLKQPLVMRLLRLANRVTTVSQFMKRYISANRRIHGIQEDEIEVIYNGVNTELFCPGTGGDEIRQKFNLGNSPLILYVGRVTPEKGIDYLLKSIPLITQQIPDVKVLIVGPFAPAKPLREREMFKRQLNDIISKLRLRNVIFTGPVDISSELPLIYKACDVLVVPSISEEAFPNVSLEAMASGKPVVATRSGGIPEIIRDGEVGYIVPKGQEKELAEALITILVDHGLRRRMGRAARQIVETAFSWNVVAKRYLELYQEAINVQAA